MVEKSTKPDQNEIAQVLFDLRQIIPKLEMMVARLERCLDNPEPVQVKQKIKKQVSKNEDLEKTKTSEGFKRERTSFKKKSSKTEAVNTTVIETVESSGRPSVVVKDIKKKFEYVAKAILEGNKGNNGDSNSVVNEEVHLIKNKDVNVNVRSLKQRFELDNESVSNNTYDKLKTERRRRESEEKIKPLEARVSGEYEEKVMKILKYFQPRS